MVLKRLSDAEIETLYTRAKKWGDATVSPDYHMHLIQIELSLRILDKLNGNNDRKLVLA